MIYNRSGAEVSLNGAAREVVESPEARAALDAASANGTALRLRPSDASASVDFSTLVVPFEDVATEVVLDYAPGTTSAKTWATGEDEWTPRATTPDPYIVIYPDDRLGLSDHNLTASVTQRAAFLTDYEDFRKLQEDPIVGSFVRSAEPVAERWATGHQTMGQIFWVYLGALAMAVVLALVSGFAAFAACLQIFRQRLRAAYVHGVIPWGILIGGIVAELAVAGFVAGYLWDRSAFMRENGPGGEFYGAAGPDLLAAMSVPTASWWLALGLVALTSLPVVSACLYRVATRALIAPRS